MMYAEDVQHIYVQVALGTPKSKSPFHLTDEMSAFWDQLVPEVAAIVDRGGTLDFPDMEFPEPRRPVRAPVKG